MDTVALGGARSQCILAALLLDANRVVSMRRLVAAAWGEGPPQGARTQVQNRLSALRRVFREANLGADVIVRRGSGYLIEIREGQLDLHRFDNELVRADALAASGQVAEAAVAINDGLALWRGPALDGLATPHLQAAAERIEERRLAAVEKRIQIELDLGRHGELVPELTGLASAHPYREGLHGRLMLALYRAGRQAEALEAFRRARLLLSEQLGVEPGPDLQRLHEAVLRGDEALIRAARPAALTPQVNEGTAPVPRELPADITGFAGRAEALTALDGMLPDAANAAVPVVISAISGTAGVGKTALAVHWAHRVAHRFPDGQLYVNLRGYGADAPVPPIEALGALLRALGVRPDRVPADAGEAAAMYRSLLAGRSVLVLLDNARSAEQVRPLLPGGPGCLVLITSRDRIGGLVAREGARRLTLDVLSAGEARDLLRHVLGDGRARAEPDALADLAHVCAYLPLALRIAAANLTNRPHQSIATHVKELVWADGLGALAIDGDEETSVQIALDHSYRAVPTDAQGLFRMLGHVHGPDFTPEAAAALMGTTPAQTEKLLDRLAAAHLIEERSPHQFSFHDLLRQYARKRSSTEAERATGQRHQYTESTKGPGSDCGNSNESR
ncbi:AfsR/SARP family transcriptional regulator [Asanoa ishikariensis]|uniref:AfsR/SARP family transcriptional regulator n=1 Tax=Asanoa ishikariensis TaxID=137265 RepID=UPI00115FB79C|nr:AfsR/SARP family transcriptional regulator [Asanoa ishikariensis]